MTKQWMNWTIVTVFSLVMMGCMSIGTTYDDGMRVRTVGETNMFRPSLSVMEVSVCVDKPGHMEVNTVDGETETCHGFYHPLATVQGTQSGALTGIGGAMIQGGAIVGGAYLVGDGLRDSASRTDVTQTGGGAENRSTAFANASPSQTQTQSQSQKNGMKKSWR